MTSSVASAIPGHGQVVGELAFVAFGALTLFEEQADDRLGIHSFAHRLNRFEQRVQLILGFGWGGT